MIDRRPQARTECWHTDTVHCRCIWQPFATTFAHKTSSYQLQEYISTNAEKLGEMHMNESSKTESNAFKVCSTMKHNFYLELVAEGTFWPDELYPTKLIQSLE